MNAREVLKDRDGIVRSISPDDTVFDAIKTMDSFKVGALMVIDKSEKLVGIISERDYTRKVVLKDRSSNTTKVSQIMTKKIAQVGPMPVSRNAWTSWASTGCVICRWSKKGRW